MYEYDRVVMKNDGNGFECESNTVVMLELTDEQDTQLSENRFIVEEVSESEVHLIVNRLDVEAVNIASAYFWKTYG